MDCANDPGVTLKPKLNVAPDGALMYLVNVDFTPLRPAQDCGSFTYRVDPTEARATWIVGAGCT